MEAHVFHDCWELLNSFSKAVDETKSAEFPLFGECWRQMQFHHIYSGQSNYVEIIATTLAALHLGKRVACGKSSNGKPAALKRAQRIGGIYLLYAIYNKQPTKEFIKIEVSPSTWTTLTNYVEQLRNESGEARDTQQVAYIFWKLVQQKAFRYTALDFCVALDGLIDYDKVEENAALGEPKKSELKHNALYAGAQLDNQLKDAFTLREALNPLCELETQYNEHKQALMGSNKEQEQHTMIFSQLKEAFDDITDMLDDGKPSTSKVNKVKHKKEPSDDQLEVRQKIKMKAMSSAAAALATTAKPEPPMDVEDENESEEEISPPPSSYKARITGIFGEPLPADVAKILVKKNDYEEEEGEEEEDEEIEDADE